jgi:S1-C subfamily serine protease
MTEDPKPGQNPDGSGPDPVPQQPYGPVSYGPQPAALPPGQATPVYGQATPAYGDAVPAYGQAMPYGETPYGQPAWIPQQGWWAPPPIAPLPGVRRRKHRRAIVGSVAGAAAAAIAIGSIAFAVERANDHSSQQTSVTTPNSDPFSQNGQPGSGQSTPQYGWGNPYGSNGGSGGGSGLGSGSGGTTTAGSATATQQVGVVDINTVLDYGAGKAAGTGMVLTSSGVILTNNHVVADSTSVSVTVVSTGKSYTATVVGTDPTDDIAVLQLKNASGLSTAKLGDSSKVAVGNTVTAVGNAGGAGGVPSAATGTVTAINQSITASDGNGTNAEQLTGMIEVNADIQAGDSGGPLYATNGTVVGIDTAASSARASGNTTGYAIPIAKALSVAGEIESGNASSKIHLGYPAFLGVQLQAANQLGSAAGATIDGVVAGSGAAKAGLQAGDTITAVNGKAVASAADLSTTMAGFKSGQRITVSWTDAAGKSHSASVTLGSGPAD